MKKLFFLTVAIVLCSFCYCQVSYESTPTRSNPYVQPFDLNLLKEVNAQKQNKYNNNAKALQERFKTYSKLIDYISSLNHQLFIDEYNKIINTANANDLSDPSIVNFINQKLDRLDQVIDYSMKNPIMKLKPDVF